MEYNKTANKILQSYSGVSSYPTLNKNYGLEIVNFGIDNNVPQLILSLNGQSPINSSIINNKVTYVCGVGVKAEDEKKGKGYPNLFEGWAEFIEKVSRDYVTFGAFAFQVVMNKDRASFSYYHQDVSRVRVSKFDEVTGDAITYAVCRDWSNAYRYAPIEIAAWGSEQPEYGKPYLFYYRSYAPSQDFYGLPDYWSALNYIEADGNLAIFYNSLIKNNFNPSTVISFPNNYDDATKNAIMSSISNFSNPESSGNVLALWLDGGDAPTIEKLDASNMAEQYNAVEEKIFQKLMSAHRLTSPTLAGLSGSGSLSGNANEIINAYILYNMTVIDDYRKDILRAINHFQALNGYSDLEIVPYDLPKEISKSKAEGEEAVENGYDENDAQDNKQIEE